MLSPEGLPDGERFTRVPRVSIRDAWRESWENKAKLTLFAVEVGSTLLLVAGGVGYLTGEATSLKALSDAAKPVALSGAAGLGVFAMGYAGLSAACRLD